jgi:hypothetical protein
MMGSQEGFCPKELVIIRSDIEITKLNGEICED